jgi:hypothetical protein
LNTTEFTKQFFVVTAGDNWLLFDQASAVDVLPSKLGELSAGVDPEPSLSIYLRTRPVVGTTPV